MQKPLKQQSYSFFQGTMKSLRALEEEIVLNQSLFNAKVNLAVIKKKCNDNNYEILKVYSKQAIVIGNTKSIYNEILRLEGEINTKLFKLKSINVKQIKKNISESALCVEAAVEKFASLIDSMFSNS